MNSLESRKILDKAKYYLKSELSDKYLICEILCNDFYKNYYIDEELSNMIKSIIINKKTFNYVKFKNQKIAHEISVLLFYNNKQHNLTEDKVMKVIKHLLSSEFTDMILMHDIHKYIIDNFNNNNIHDYIDILSHTYIKSTETIKILTEMKNFVKSQLPINKTIYDDSQNVHTTEINTSVLRAAYKLQKLYPNNEDCIDIIDLMDKLTLDDLEVIERIETDCTIFSYNSNNFTLENVFISLLKFIECHDESDELYARLSEQLNEMFKYCSTGYLSRLISSIQGYTEDDDLIIRISERDRLKSIIFTCLNKELSKEMNEQFLMDLHDSKSLKFISDVVNKNFMSWKTDVNMTAPEFSDAVVSIIESYVI